MLPSPTLQTALQWLTQELETVDPDTAMTEARWILSHRLQLPPVDVWLHGGDRLSEADADWLHQVIARRRAREPLAYIMGEAEFFGLTLEITPDVLIPRPETERLVELTIPLVEHHPAPRVADVGTGSGAMVLALATQLPHATFVATDISANALAVAQRNAERHHLASRLAWAEGSLLVPLRELGLTGSLDALVSNPPYIRSKDLPTLQAEIADYEPAVALDGGSDGLDLIRCLIGEAHTMLRSGGWFLCEIGADQGAQVETLARAEVEWSEVKVAQDWGKRDRVLMARRRETESRGAEGQRSGGPEGIVDRWPITSASWDRALLSECR